LSGVGRTDVLSGVGGTDVLSVSVDAGSEDAPSGTKGSEGGDLLGRVDLSVTGGTKGVITSLLKGSSSLAPFSREAPPYWTVARRPTATQDLTRGRGVSQTTHR
jgi:hypothetical protein